MIGSIGGPELVLILALALLLFGPRKLPEIGRSFGKALAEFRGTARDFKSELEREVELEELKQVRGEVVAAQKDIASVAREATRLDVDEPRPAPSSGNDETRDA